MAAAAVEEAKRTLEKVRDKRVQINKEVERLKQQYDMAAAAVVAATSVAFTILFFEPRMNFRGIGSNPDLK